MDDGVLLGDRHDLDALQHEGVRGEGGLVPLVEGEALQILQNACPEFFEEIFVQDLCGHLVRDPFA